MRVGCFCSYALNPAFVESLQVTSRGWLWYYFPHFSCVWVPRAFAHSDWLSMCLGFLLLAAIKLTHSEDPSTFPITLNYAVCWNYSPTLAIMLLMHVALHAPVTLCSVIAWVLHWLCRCPMPSNMSVNLLISSALSCPYADSTVYCQD